MTSRSATPTLPYLVMFVSPLFFSTNLVFGRYLAANISPFLLATIRWGMVPLVLSPLMFGARAAIASLVFTHWRHLLVLGFLGMCICGGIVYTGLNYTTATNATLIYTVSPVFIVLIERVFSKRLSRRLEILGVAAAIIGVGVIVFRGSWRNAITFSFNVGDLLILSAAASWAVYSVLYRTDSLRLVGNMQLLGLVAVFGTLCNLPFAILEIWTGSAFPERPGSWLAVLGIVIFPSLLAYSTYQYGVRMLGPSVTGIFMYLMVPYGVILAVLFLREELLPFHFVGIALVMSGVILATFPRDFFTRR